MAAPRSPDSRWATVESPFSNTEGDPVVLYHKPTGTWFTVWLDAACGAQGLGGYKSTTPANAASWTHFTCIHSNSQDDRESGWSDNNPASPFYGRMYISWNDFNVGGGALFATYSTDAGTTWAAPVVVSNTVPSSATRRLPAIFRATGSCTSPAWTKAVGGSLTTTRTKSLNQPTVASHGPTPTRVLRFSRTGSHCLGLLCLHV